MKASFAADLSTGLLEGDILRSLRIPLAVIDNDFRYLWLNREMAWIYQTHPEHVTGKICYKLHFSQTGPCQDCPVAAVQKSGRREVTNKYKDFPNGVRKYGEISAFPIHGPHKNIEATLMMVIDVTDKIIAGMDDPYQMIARLMPSLRGLMRPPQDPSPPKRVNGKNGRPLTVSSNLTHRETQVLNLLAKGHSNTKIASSLGISHHTVKSHVINIFNKLGVNDRIQAAVVATKQQIIE